VRKIEILSPAGNLDKLNVAFRFGADAVYLGGKAFNLRARSGNFSLTELKSAIDNAHAIGKKVYVTLNILAHDREINALPTFIKMLGEAGADAVIVADLGVIDLVREFSDLPIHISTQASSTNWRSVRAYQKLGAKRVVLARECTIDEMKRIKDAVPEMELEVFVHGSMCMTYSGRCNLSNYLSERDGNRGSCTNSCRWKYALQIERRPGEYYPVEEDETGTYIYNSKDLCTVEFLDKILDAGVDGLKIEGRMKSMFYCATTTRVYREALEAWRSGNWAVDPEWLQRLMSYSHRNYTSGFYLGRLDRKSENLKGSYRQTHKFLGYIGVDAQGGRVMHMRDKYLAGDRIEVLKPSGENLFMTVDDMISTTTELPVTTAQPSMILKAGLPDWVEPWDVLIQEVPSDEREMSERPAPNPADVSDDDDGDGGGDGDAFGPELSL
jgi:putative protease